MSNCPAVCQPKTLKAAQCTGQSRELEGPGDPNPFWQPNEEGEHAYGADNEHKPVATWVLDVFFVLFHVVQFFMMGQK